MRYLGIDYGSRRIGLALSDAEGRMGFPYGTLGSLGEVVAVIRREGIGTVVMGFPDVPGRSESPQAREIRRFAGRLERAVQLPVVFESEAYTTKIARRSSPPEKADASAAALILQSYLDKILSSKP